jgi:hypothetical protein
MAASDLTQEVCGNNCVLELSVQKNIMQKLLKQLEDGDLEVQGNAVKCLAKIVRRGNVVNNNQ